MYSGVPGTVPGAVRLAAWRSAVPLLRPKSSSLATSLLVFDGVRKMLPGLMSRCRTWTLCSTRSASAICSRSHRLGPVERPDEADVLVEVAAGQQLHRHDVQRRLAIGELDEAHDLRDARCRSRLTT